MSTSRRTEDPAQADRAWTGYHPRAAVPAITVAAVASLVVWTGRWYLDDLSELADRAGALVVFALAWCVWPGLLAAYLYRTVTYSYRLTDEALLIDFGFRSAPVPTVRLSEVTDVRAGSGWVGRLLGIGWVELRSGARTVRMVGVRHPAEWADQIRAGVAACRHV